MPSFVRIGKSRTSPTSNAERKAVEVEMEGHGIKPGEEEASPQAPANASTQEGFTFGEKIDAIIDYSPLLKKELARLKKEGWTINDWHYMSRTPGRGHSGSGSFTQKSAKFIRMDPKLKNDPKGFVRTLAHEIGHAISPIEPDTSSLDHYIDTAMAEEGWAILFNLRVQREIILNSEEVLGDFNGIDIDYSPKIGSDEIPIIFSDDYVSVENPNVYDVVVRIGDVVRCRSVSGPDANQKVTYEFYYRQYHRIHLGQEVDESETIPCKPRKVIDLSKYGLD